MTQTEKSTNPSHGAADGKPKPRRQQPKSKPKEQGTKKPRAERARETAILRKSILNVNRKLALGLFNTPEQAKTVIGSATTTVKANPRLNVKSLKELAERIYDKDHFSWNRKTDETQYSDVFLQHFQPDREEESTKQLPVKPAPTKRNQRKTVTAKRDDLLSDEFLDEGSGTPPAEEDISVGDAIKILETMLNKGGSDDGEEEPTPKATNMSMEEGFEYEPQNFLDLPHPENTATDQQHEEEARKPEARPHQAGKEQVDTSTISSKDSNQTVDYKALWEELQQNSEANTILMEQRMDQMETALNEHMLALATLREEVEEKDKKLETLEQKLNHMEDNMVDQQQEHERLLHIGAILKNKLQHIELVNLHAKAKEIEEKAAAQIEDMAKKAATSRASIQRDVDRFSAFYQGMKQNIPGTVQRAVKTKVDPMIAATMESVQATFRTKMDEWEKEMATTRNEATRELDHHVNLAFGQLEQRVTQLQDEVDQDASRSLETDSVGYQQAFQTEADDILERSKGRLTTQMKAEFEESLPSFLQTLKEITRNQLRIVKSSIQGSVEVAVHREVDAKTQEIIEEGITRFDNLKDQKVQELRQHVNQQKLEAQAVIEEDAKTCIIDQMKAMLRDDDIAFDTHPIAEYIKQQVLSDIAVAQARETQRNQSIDKEEIEQAQGRIKLASSEAIIKFDQTVRDRKLEFEKMARDHKKDLQDRYNRAYNSLATEAEQQQTIAANRRVEEDQRYEERKAEENRRYDDRMAHHTQMDEYMQGLETLREHHDSTGATSNQQATATEDQPGQPPPRQQARRPLSHSYQPYSPERFIARRTEELQAAYTQFHKDFKGEHNQQPIMNAIFSQSWYQTIYEACRAAGIPMVHWDKLDLTRDPLDPKEREYMETHMKDVLRDIKNTMFTNIQKMAHPDDKVTSDILALHAISRDGYMALFDIVKHWHAHLKEYPQKWAQAWDPEDSPTVYYGKLKHMAGLWKRGGGKEKSRLDIFVELLQQAAEHPKYHHLTGGLMSELGLSGPHALMGRSPEKLVAVLETAHQKPGTSSAGNQAIHPTINRMTTARNNRAARRAKVQCELCKASGHSLDSNHICYLAAQLFHLLDYFSVLPTLKIPQNKLKLFQENATKFEEWHQAKTINVIQQRFSEIDLCLPTDELTAAMGTTYYTGLPVTVPPRQDTVPQQTPTEPKDFH